MTVIVETRNRMVATDCGTAMFNSDDMIEFKGSFIKSWGIWQYSQQ